MTKIAFNPNVNGTGTFTIAAPNSNTNRTFTLPDATGDIITSAGGTITSPLTVNINSGQNLFQTQDVNNYARFTQSSGSAQIGLFRTGAPSGGMYIGGDGDQFSVWSSSFQRRLNVSQAGYVTMPNQPAFQVRGTYSGGIGAGGKFTFTSALGGQSPEATFDRTGSWSDANSRYTAPVTGVYQFNFSVYTQAVQSVIQSLAPRVNGSQLSTGDNLIFFRSATGETGNTDNQVSGSFLLKLNANDYVELFVRLGAPSFTTYSGHTNFSGFLTG